MEERQIEGEIERMYERCDFIEFQMSLKFLNENPAQRNHLAQASHVSLNEKNKYKRCERFDNNHNISFTLFIPLMSLFLPLLLLSVFLLFLFPFARVRQ